MYGTPFCLNHFSDFINILLPTIAVSTEAGRAWAAPPSREVTIPPSEPKTPLRRFRMRCRGRAGKRKWSFWARLHLNLRDWTQNQSCAQTTALSIPSKLSDHLLQTLLPELSTGSIDKLTTCDNKTISSYINVARSGRTQALSRLSVLGSYPALPDGSLRRPVTGYAEIHNPNRLTTPKPQLKQYMKIMSGSGALTLKIVLTLGNALCAGGVPAPSHLSLSCAAADSIPHAKGLISFGGATSRSISAVLTLEIQQIRWPKFVVSVRI